MATKAVISAIPGRLIDRILRTGHSVYARLPNKFQSPSSSRTAPQSARTAHREGEASMAQVSRYHPLLVALHWLLAFLTIAALALGALVMAKIPNTDPMKLEALRSHMIGGTLILVMMLVRLVLRTRTEHP